MAKALHYTPDGEVIKTKIVKLIESLPGADRAIDIIYQTPDLIILPYIERAVKANKSPEQIIRVIKAAESNIFTDYQVAPWDEIHHGRMSLVSARNVRHMNPTARVEALNKLADKLGGPIGNSRFNLRGNAADRRSHTGGMIPKNRVTEEEMSGLNRPDRSQSMHPFGTNAQKDPRPEIVVTETSDPARYVDQALKSSKAQFNDTVSGRYSDMARRITVEKMISGTRRGDVSTETPLLYGTQAKPGDVKAAKIFLQENGNGSLRLNMLRSWALPGTDQWETFMKDPINAGLAELYGEDLYNAGLGKGAYNQLKKAVKTNPTGLAAGALLDIANDDETLTAIDKSQYGTAAARVGTAALAGAAVETGIKSAINLLPKGGALQLGFGAAADIAAPVALAVGALGAANTVTKHYTGKDLTEHYVERRKRKTAELAAVPEQLFPAPKAVSARNNPLGIARLTQAPKPKPINPANEALYIGKSLFSGRLPYTK